VVQRSGPPTISFNAGQTTSGGNTGAYRTLLHYYGGPGSIITAHLNSSALYQPVSHGAVASVSFSFDLLLVDGGDSNAVAYGALASQSGELYLSQSFLTTLSPMVGVWINRQASGLTPGDFSPLRPDAPPLDLSATAPPVIFGYFASNGTASASSTSTQSGIDNWYVALTPVPEPATSSSLIVGIVAVGGIARRRFSTAA
jgi:hypothetical protein